MKRFFNLRTLLWTLASLITLYILLVTLENWTGARALAAAKEMLHREGETLDFQKLIHPPIPEATNFCAIEPLVGITQLQHADGEPESAKEKALKSIRLNPSGKSAPKTPATGSGFDLARPIDLNAWTKFLHETHYLSTAANATPAEILAALDQEKPLLRQLSDAAATRRDAAFTPPIGPGPNEALFAIRLPHLNFAQLLSRALALRAEYAIAAGNSAEAVRSMQAVLRLTVAMARDPLLISQLVSVTSHVINEQSIWSMLRQQRATEEQLATLQSDLQQLDFLAASLLAMRGELAAGYDMLRHLKSQPEDFGMMLGAFDSAPLKPWVSKVAFSIIPSGWMDHSAARLIQVEHDLFLKPAKAGTHAAHMAASEELETFIQQRSLLRVHDLLASLAVPALSQVMHRVYYTEAVHRQSIIAIALERYQLQHQKYPTALAELVPAFLKAVPLDPIDGQPMRYRIPTEGRYEIWSIAANSKDDGVKAPTDTKDIAKPSYAGDWVWRYSPEALK